MCNTDINLLALIPKKPKSIQVLINGNNSQYKIFTCSGGVEVVSFRIYDKWGNLVFAHNNNAEMSLEITWDGTYERQVLSSGVYIYLLEILDYNNELAREGGHINLLR